MVCLRFARPKTIAISRIFRILQWPRNRERKRSRENKIQKNVLSQPRITGHNNITASDTDGMSEPRWDVVGYGDHMKKKHPSYGIAQATKWFIAIFLTRIHTCSALSHAQCSRHDINTVRYTVTLNIIYIYNENTISLQEWRHRSDLQ